MTRRKEKINICDEDVRLLKEGDVIWETVIFIFIQILARNYKFTIILYNHAVVCHLFAIPLLIYLFSSIGPNRRVSTVLGSSRYCSRILVHLKPELSVAYCNIGPTYQFVICVHRVLYNYRNSQPRGVIVTIGGYPEHELRMYQVRSLLNLIALH